MTCECLMDFVLNPALAVDRPGLTNRVDQNRNKSGLVYVHSWAPNQRFDDDDDDDNDPTIRFNSMSVFSV